MNLRWYERPWRRMPSGRRAKAAASLYLVVGAAAIVLAVMSSTAVQRSGWMALAAVVTYLGASLCLTLRRRRG